MSLIVCCVIALLLTASGSMRVSEAQWVVGPHMPYLPPLGGFMLTEHGLDYTGDTDMAAMVQHVQRFWQFTHIWNAVTGENPRDVAFASAESPSRAAVTMTNIDMETETMRCQSAVALTPRARQMLTALGCVWPES
jgi:hypothetical protein